MTKEEGLLSEIARKLRKLDCICEGVNSTGNIIIEGYQPLDCNGDPVGSPISVMPTISVAKQDVNICNVTQLAEAIAGGTYNEPWIESAYTDWNMSTSSVITKVHSVTVTIIGTAGGTVDLTIGGSPITLPVGFSGTWQATTTFNVDFVLTNFTGGATAIISLIRTV